MIYIIMCGGDMSNHPKHLSKVCGEILVNRTIRLLKDSGVSEDDIYISSNNPIFDMFKIKRISHSDNKFLYKDGDIDNPNFWVDAYVKLSIPATYIHGDVYFSPEAIKKIVEYDTKEITFFGTDAPYDERYIKEYQEPLAYKVINQTKFKDCIRWVKLHFKEFNRHPIAWELWEVINNQPINELYLKGDFVAIRDYTCDIDAPKDINKIEKALGWSE